MAILLHCVSAQLLAPRAYTARRAGARAAVGDGVQTMLSDPVSTNEITRQIIGAAIKVHRALGPGLLESAYSVCLAFELQEQHLCVETKKAVALAYGGLHIDAIYWLDMLVNGLVIVELKAVESLAPVHKAQLLTYLKLTKCPVGLLMNFNVPMLKDGIQRIVNPDLRRSQPT